jgi:uncharacterized protein
VYIGVVKLVVVVAHSKSLKDKRMVVRRIKDRVRERLGLAVAEVGELDHRQRAELGCTVCSGDRVKALSLIDDVVRVAQTASGGAVAHVAKDALTFDAPMVEAPPPDDRTGAADKAAAGDDWVPEAWRDDD